MINKRLEELLNEKKISPEELSSKLKFSGRARVYEWLRGDYIPQFENLIKLADFFECSLEYLIGRTEYISERNFKITQPFDVQLKKIMKSKNVSQYKMIKDKVVNSSHFNLWFKNYTLSIIHHT